MKIALDTNILIRLLTIDHAHLALKAKNLINKYDTKEIFITYGAALEISYVLKSVYKYSENQALEAIGDILKIPQFAFEHEVAIRLALSKAQKGVGFYDALIGEIGASKNVKTYTFDKGLKNNSSFEVI